MRLTQYIDRSAVLCTLVYVAAVTAAPSADTPRAAGHTISDIQRRLREVNGKIRSYHVVYDSSPKHDSIKGFVHREIAAYSPASYFHWSAHGTSRYAPAQDPFQQRLKIHENVAINEYPSDRAFIRAEVRRGDPLPGSAPQELLFFALGWWTLEAFKAPEPVPGAPAALSEVAKSDKYAVWPDQVWLHRRWCHVLEYPRKDRIWLDVERGCAIVMRELFNPETGAVVQRIEAFDHHEVGGGIWAPARLRNLIFNREDDRRADVDAEIFLREINVNEAPPPKLFNFQPASGSIEILTVDHFEQRVPGGEDHLDGIVARLKLSGEREAAGGSMGINTMTAAINIVSSVCVVAIMVIYRRGMWR